MCFSIDAPDLPNPMSVIEKNEPIGSRADEKFLQTVHNKTKLCAWYYSVPI